MLTETVCSEVATTVVGATHVISNSTGETSYTVSMTLTYTTISTMIYHAGTMPLCP